MVSGLVKLVFGMIISIMGCYHGYHSGGAQGVGKATTNAVVSSSILALFFDFILTGMFFVRWLNLKLNPHATGPKEFGSKMVLDGNLDIKKGESVAVIGGSGVGSRLC